MPKHTPGPWHWEGTHSEYGLDTDYLASPMGTVLLPVSGWDKTDLGIRTGDNRETATANRNLIKAAPDLLAACVGLVQMYVKLGMDTPSMPGYEKTTVEVAREAINKATRESDRP